MLQILALCGSLRQKSTNKTLLQAAARLAPRGMTISLYEDLGQLPHFNPDIESNEPMEVTRFREAIRSFDGLLICSPEYAHGIPGSLKNALDWLVGGSEIVGKPVALLTASTRSSYAQESLREVLRTMSARLIEEAGLDVHLLGKNSTVDELAADPELAQKITEALRVFALSFGDRF
ncbi:MAG TPA: NADPH-dependent FMN reductase [bacterium]|nr:NADPH-dependent FMN reductase [bacterium]